MAESRGAGSIPHISGDRAIKKRQKSGLVLLNEPDPSVREALTFLLANEGWDVTTVDTCEELVEAVKTHGVVAVISESSLPDCTPEDLLASCLQLGTPVVFTGHDLPLQGAVDLIRQGAMDFLDKPFPQSRLLDLLERLRTMKKSDHNHAHIGEKP
ncbi:MAG: response regulator [Xanthomonadales bacterium]